MADNKQTTQPQTRPGRTGQPITQPYTDTEEKSEPKMSVTEIVFITPFYLISDAIDLSLFLTGLDDFGIMDTVRTSLSQIYFVVIKKMGQEIWLTNLIVNAIKLFPYIGSLVPSTLLWFVIVFIDRAGMAKIQKLIQATGKLGKIAKTVGEKTGKITGKS
jgi:hypothetical protein